MSPNPRRRNLWLCVFLFAAGCAVPAQIRMPTLWYGSPAAQKQELERHDPFPDDTLGPPTMSRPRNADVQRSEPRRIRETTVPPWALPPRGGPEFPPATTPGGAPPTGG